MRNQDQRAISPQEDLEINKLTHEWDVLTLHIKEVQYSLQLRKNQLDEKDTSLHDKEKKIGQAEDNLKKKHLEMELANVRLTDERDELEQACKMLENHKQRMNVEIEEIFEAQRFIVAEKASLKDYREALEKEKAEMILFAESLKHQKATLTLEMDLANVGLTEDREKLARDWEMLKNHKQGMRVEIERLLAAQRCVSAEKDSLQDCKEALEKERAEMISFEDSLKKQQASLMLTTTQNAQDMSRQHAALSQRIETLNATQLRQQELNKELKKDQEMLDQKIMQDKARVEAEQLSLQNREKNIEKKEAAFDKLKVQLKEDIKKTGQQKAVLDEQIVQLQNLQVASKQHCAGIKEKLDCVEQQAQSVAQQVQDLNALQALEMSQKLCGEIDHGLSGVLGEFSEGHGDD